MSAELVTVFGGSGFVGRHLVRRLADAGRRIRVAVRDPEAAMFLKPMGAVGQIDFVQANLRNDASVHAAIAGSRDVVNLVGILAPRGRQTFTAVHVEGAERVARAAAHAGVARLVHLSAIGADTAAPSAYGRSKADGEARVRAAFPGATVLRPSVVVGPEDDFLNRFGALARCLPALPLFGGSNGPRLQPVAVGDVAEALFRCLNRPETAGRVFELGGPEVLTLREIYRRVLAITGYRRGVVNVPFAVGGVLATLCAVLPVPKLFRITADELLQLRSDNVVSEQMLGFAELGIEAAPMATVAPEVLALYHRRSPAPAA